LTRLATLRLPVVSRSSTGGRSPPRGCATSTKWSACAIPLAVSVTSFVPAGRAKWYAPIGIAAAFAPDRFRAYVVSVNVVPSDALRNEKP